MTKKETGIELFIDQSKLPVPIESILEGTAQSVLVKKDGLIPYYEHVRSQVDNLVFDASTEEGRKAMIDLSRKVSKAKALIEKPARVWLKEYKAKIKPAESNVNEFPKLMDALRDKVRAPADEWQAEQDRIAKTKQDVIDFFSQVISNAKEQLPNMSPAVRVEQLEIRIKHAQEFDISPAQERKEEAKKAQDYCVGELNNYLAFAEKQLAQEQEAQRIREEEIARQAREEAIKANEDQIRKLELAKEAAELRAKQEREDAEKRAEIAAQKAREDEQASAKLAVQNRQSEIAEKEDSERAMAEDLEHRKSCNIEAMNALLDLGIGLTKEQAQEIVKAAVLQKIARIKMYY